MLEFCHTDLSMFLGWKRRLVEDGVNGAVIQYIGPEGTAFSNKQQVPLSLILLPDLTSNCRRFIFPQFKLVQIPAPLSPPTEPSMPLLPQVAEHLKSISSPLSPDWFIFSTAVILEKEIEYEVGGKSHTQLHRGSHL